MDEFLEKIKSELVNSFMQIPNTMAKIFDKNLLSNFKTEEGKIGVNEKDDLIEESVDSIFSSSYDSSNEQKKIEKIEKVKKRVKKKKLLLI